MPELDEVRSRHRTEANPFETLRNIAGGYALPRCLHIVADFGVADALDETPRTARELAGSVGADADALSRMMRLLSAHGVFETRDDDRFAHSPASRLLRTDHPQSMRALARMFGLSINWNSYGSAAHTLRTGRAALEDAYPDGFFAHFAKSPEESAVFNGAMAAKAQGQVTAIVDAYDFSRFERIGDVGGGRGHLLQAVLATAPKAHGVLVDLPHVVADAREIATERLTLQAADFFKDPLPRCDVYLLMEVVHDWGDTESLAIFQAVRRAAAPGAKLLVIESIVPDDPGPHWSKTLDVHMLILLGGRQRTRPEYEALLDRAGFSLRREIPTFADISILESEAI
jgi:O-methyltransferase